MGQRARVRRVCERAAFASIAVLGAPACLNELDPSIAGNLCRGNVVNGVLDGGEECDDGNLESGDGCDRCRVECPSPGRKDPVNAHCYLPVRAASFAGAEDQCRATSSALPTRPLTVRSPREAAFLRDVVFADRPPGQRPRVRTGYAFGVATLLSPTGFFGIEAEINFRQAAPSPFRAEPGVLAYYTAGAADTAAAKTARPAPGAELLCTGCYAPFAAGAADGEAWWGEPSAALAADPPERGLAFDVESGVFVPVDLDQTDGAGLETLCERVSNNAPRNEPCPGCPVAPLLRFRLGASLYSYFDEYLDMPAAVGRCADLGAVPWIVDDEDERERVVRLLAAGSAPPAPPAFARSSWPVPSRAGVWVGATKGPDGAWSWADGTPAVGDRAVPWAVDPRPPLDADCGYVALRGEAFDLVETASSDAFAVGLVVPAACAQPPGSPADPVFLPGLLCEQAAPLPCLAAPPGRRPYPAPLTPRRARARRRAGRCRACRRGRRRLARSAGAGARGTTRPCARTRRRRCAAGRPPGRDLCG
jgi:cysteine-rich repeat protein